MLARWAQEQQKQHREGKIHICDLFGHQHMQQTSSAEVARVSTNHCTPTPAWVPCRGLEV